MGERTPEWLSAFGSMLIALGLVLVGVFLIAPASPSTKEWRELALCSGIMSCLEGLCMTAFHENTGGQSKDPTKSAVQPAVAADERRDRPHEG
jgi:hypothetical protein